ncbi:GPP34 family phosphoprotein [Streptomyces sp. NPDC006265]|uniref:GOLPH3/VPS74 family protein n=1 Tax=Streptomyces sp. NPDC006265 TaxID=3156740 RepID=UPI0033AB66C9
MTDDKVTVVDATPLGEPALDTALADIAGRDKPGRTRDWITRLKTDAAAWANRGLIEKGLVREEKKKVLGLFSVRRYPEADGSAEAAVRRRLDEVVLRGAAPDERTACLVALLHGAKLHRLAFPDADGRAVREAMVRDLLQCAVTSGRPSAARRTAQFEGRLPRPVVRVEVAGGVGGVHVRRDTRRGQFGTKSRLGLINALPM